MTANLDPYRIDHDWLWGRDEPDGVAVLRCVVTDEDPGRAAEAVAAFLESLPADEHGMRGRGGWAAVPVEGENAVDLVSGGEDVADGIEWAAEEAHAFFSRFGVGGLEWVQGPEGSDGGSAR
ncbi:hypothetical protein [uncultured Tessaracoccus sp.]|uniref:hypothetical protein n=1 Tax=uncultured Tessaracoccus sp. TaxID=905023 RepID=UPI0025D911B6|nr:hypothetical protein [uncultured Tessaracoccus sp.]